MRLNYFGAGFKLFKPFFSLYISYMTTSYFFYILITYFYHVFSCFDQLILTSYLVFFRLYINSLHFFCVFLAAKGA